MKKIIEIFRLSLLLVGLSANVFAHAATESEPDRPGTGAESEERRTSERDATAETASEDDKEQSGEVFLPTEEISEDYAAPFPVDI